MIQPHARRQGQARGLLEILLVGVGTGIAKGIVTLWFGDHPVGDELGKGVIDVVKKMTDDVLARRSPGERPSRRYIRREEPVATTGAEWPVTPGLSLTLSF